MFESKAHIVEPTLIEVIKVAVGERGMYEGRDRVDQKLRIGELDFSYRHGLHVTPTVRVATPLAGVRQRAKQLARAVPYDLHSYANQQKRSELNNNVGSRRT